MDAWKVTQFKVISLFSNASVQIFDEFHWFWSRFCGFRFSILIISRQTWLFATECLCKRLNIDCFMFSYFPCQQYSFIRNVWHLLWFKNDESIDLLFIILCIECSSMKIAITNINFANWTRRSIDQSIQTQIMLSNNGKLHSFTYSAKTVEYFMNFLIPSTFLSLSLSLLRREYINWFIKLLIEFKSDGSVQIGLFFSRHLIVLHLLSNSHCIYLLWIHA